MASHPPFLRCPLSMSRRHRGGATSSASTPWLIGGYLYGVRVARGRCAKAYALLMVLVLAVMPPGLLIVFLLLPSILGWSRRLGLLMLLTALAGVGQAPCGGVAVGSFVGAVRR